ncbi:MAG: hypothetical protein F9K29_20080 [Hyphomicrobiaceae bacterium]|nr:MAG: hypothetical protein F9K29_20080 [Hyphomicrobiaceae bacterium]
MAIIDWMREWLLEGGGRDPIAIVISAFALFFAGISSFVTIRNKAREDRRTVRTLFNSVAERIIDIQAKNDEAWVELQKSGDQLTYNLRLKANNSQLGTFARRMGDLLEELGREVSATDHSLLATAFTASRDPAAERHWTKAVSLAKTDAEKIAYIEGYAAFLYQVGRIESGRAQYDEALRLGAASGDYKESVAGRIWHLRAVQEYNAGLIEEMEASFARAEEAYCRIGNAPIRNIGLQSVAQQRDSLRKASGSSQPPITATPGV